MSDCFNLLLCRHNSRLESDPLLVKLVEVCASFCRGKASYTVDASLFVFHRHEAVLLSPNGDEELQGRLQRYVDGTLDGVVRLTIWCTFSTPVLTRDVFQVYSDMCDEVNGLNAISYGQSDHLLVYLVLRVTRRLIFITCHKVEVRTSMFSGPKTGREIFCCVSRFGRV
jgi:hypothetical protein